MYPTQIAILILVLLLLLNLYWNNTIKIYDLWSCRGELSLDTKNKVDPTDKNLIQQIVFAETTVFLKRIISDLQNTENKICSKAAFDKAKAYRTSVSSKKDKINDYFESIELQENCKVSAKFINTSTFLPDIGGKTVTIGYIHETISIPVRGWFRRSFFRYTCEFNDKWNKLPSYCKTVFRI